MEGARALRWSLWAFVGVAMLAWASATAAQELWRGTFAGMSAAEVRAVHPEVTAGDGDRLANGATADLRLVGFRLLHREGEAEFYLLDGKLHQVVERPVGLTGDAWESNMAIVQELAADLAERYGEPNECGPIANGYRCSWDTETLNIALLYLDQRRKAPILNINYRLKFLPPEPPDRSRPVIIRVQ